MFNRQRLILCGTGALTQELGLYFRQAGRAFHAAGRIADCPGPVRRAHTLVLPGIEATPGVFDQLVEICRRRPRRRPPLRVILVDEGGDAGDEPALPADARLLVERFGIERNAARVLLTRWPLHLGADPLFGQVIHVLVAGDAPPADTLRLQALRVAHYSDRPSVLTSLAADPGACRRLFETAYPQAGRFSRLRFRHIDDPGLDGIPPVTAAFVSTDPPEAGLELARQLCRRLADEQRVSPPVLLEVGRAEPVGGVGDWDGQLIPFSHRRLVLCPEVLLDGRGDELARVIHGHYRDTTAAQGRDPAVEPAGRSWAGLSSSYRDANRHQADHLWAKLAITDCLAVPEDLVESFAFAPVEVERLAMIEHGRWAADRYLDGWTYAPERDNARKHHPQLIPYAALSGPMKDLDRFAVRLAPRLLARSGLGLVRMLIVAVEESAGDDSGPGGQRAVVDGVLRRLAQRHPDRGLVIASTLADPASRLVARRALDGFAASLFVLCPRPISETLAAQPHAAARAELLALLARARRRIALPGAGEHERWLAQRAEILLGFGAWASSPGDAPVPIPKRVWIDPTRGVDWSFEY